jgi:hypothetical protein
VVSVSGARGTNEAINTNMGGIELRAYRTIRTCNAMTTNGVDNNHRICFNPDGDVTSVDMIENFFREYSLEKCTAYRHCLPARSIDDAPLVSLARDVYRKLWKGGNFSLEQRNVGLFANFINCYLFGQDTNKISK